MRLSAEDARAIRAIVRAHDPCATVKLFGSQTRDSAMGGDIDLLVFSRAIGLEERLAIEADLQDALGLRRFDILVARDSDDPFVRLADRGAIEL